MKVFNPERLKELIKSRREPCISIYIPTHYEWSEKEQDRIRFKNQLQNISAQLKEKGYDSSEIDELLNEANELYKNEDFWKHTSNGLAMFISNEETLFYRVPITFNEFSKVSYRYYIKPLLPLVSQDGRYFIIALDLNETKLYHGSKFSISEIELPKDTPTSLDDAMILDDPEKSIQFHTGAGGPKGDRHAVFHGQGTGTDDKLEKKQILRFFQMLNKGVMEILAGENVPLLIIGIEYLIPIYRDANSYSHLFKDAIDIDPQTLSPTELHKRSWEKVESHFKESEKEALNEYGNKVKENLATDELDKVIKGSVNQRVDKLFVNLEKQTWGRYDQKNDQLILDPEPTTDNEDLHDFTIFNTIENKGIVFTLENDRMPNGKSMAAVFRFPVS